MILPEFLFFDLDNTILDFRLAERNALAAALSGIGIRADDEMLDRYSILNDEQWKLLEKGQVSREILKVRRFENLFREFDIDKDPKMAAAAYEYRLGEGHFFMKDAEEVLEELFNKMKNDGSGEKAHRMFIVSNGTAVVQHSRIQSAGLEKYFERIFISEETGFNKPDRRFFEAAFDAIEGFDRKRAVIIGDSLSSDIQGGINAGIGTIWLDLSGDPSGVGTETDIHPDTVIRELRELTEPTELYDEEHREDQDKTAEGKGMVSIVGAGCGKADLMTLRGSKRLSECDAVIYDDLIDMSLLETAPAYSLKQYMGKRQGSHSAGQEEINSRLIELARQGKKVVRLKGGDPFVFGRGGEEALALRQAGIEYELIPGISSCIAVPEEAGIPVTHRGVSRSFHVVTAHVGGTESEDMYLQEEFGRLAGCEGTIVILMGLKQLRRIADILMEGGHCPDTPAAVISGGNSQNAQAVRGRLKDIADRAEEAGVTAPAVIVIGETAGMDLRNRQGQSEALQSDRLRTEQFQTEQLQADRIDKLQASEKNVVQTGDRPLSGISVGLTGTAMIRNKLGKMLTELGAFVYSAEVSVLDRLKVEDEVFEELCGGEAHWIVFTSANGVKVFFDELKDRHIDIRRLACCSFAVIGAATGRMLSEHGIEAELCPEHFTGQDLAGMMLARKNAVKYKSGDAVIGGAGREGGNTGREKVFLMRSRRGSRELAEELAKAYEVRDIPVYDLHADRETGEKAFERSGKTDYMTFSSSSGVELYFENGGCLPEGCVCVCIGEVTEKALKKHVSEYIRADSISAEGIVSSILKNSMRSHKSSDAHREDSICRR